MDSIDKMSVCIVGAGPAGLSAAYFLKQKGYSRITVLEKNDCVGGKCLTKYYGNINYSLGAVSIGPRDKNVFHLISDFGLRLVTSPVSPALIDGTTGMHHPLETLIASEKILDVTASMVKYFYYLLKYHHILRKVGFENIPRELATPFSPWLEERGMKSILNLFLPIVTCFGYGDLQEIPAIYVLKYMNLANFPLLFHFAICRLLNIRPRWPKLIDEGFQELLHKMAGTLPDVRLNACIQSISRTNEGIRVNYIDTLTGKALSIKADSLILSIPPEGNFKGLLDLTDEETTIFSRVRCGHYYTTSCRIEGDLDGFLFNLVQNGNIGIPQNVVPYMISKPVENSDIAIVYSYALSPVASDSIEHNILEFARSIGITIREVLNISEWKYFFHFDSEDVRDGFHGRLERLQGRNRTYYTGGLFNFELVENSISYSGYIINKYF
ncbi:MAG: FAD-dependent oxidoreductase [Spirochaetes bacterium]|nr:MAG: FAD-dependent oxidoreductase [Spirochaetota bacterium]